MMRWRRGASGGVRQHPGSTTALKGGLLPFLVFIQLLARAKAAPAAMMTATGERGWVWEK